MWFKSSINLAPCVFFFVFFLFFNYYFLRRRRWKLPVAGVHPLEMRGCSGSGFDGGT